MCKRPDFQYQGRPISPRLLPRSSRSMRVLIVKSGAPHPSKAPCSEFKDSRLVSVLILKSGVPDQRYGTAAYARPHAPDRRNGLASTRRKGSAQRRIAQLRMAHAHRPSPRRLGAVPRIGATVLTCSVEKTRDACLLFVFQIRRLFVRSLLTI